MQHILENWKTYIKSDMFDSTMYLLSKATNQSQVLLSIHEDNSSFNTCIQSLLSGEEHVTKDPKRRFLAVKFFAEWVEKLETTTTKSSQPLSGLLQIVFEKQFTSDNSHDINLTLLEILPYYDKREMLFSQVA